MPRRTTKDPEFGARVGEVRERLNRSLQFKTLSDYAKWLGVERDTYRPWEQRNALPSAIDLSKAFLNARHPADGRPIADAPRLIVWLATGEPFLKPAWLKDWNVDPFTETSADAPRDPSPGGAPPSNVIPIELLRGRVTPAFRRVAARELQNSAHPDLDLVRAATELDAWVRTLPETTPAPALADAGSDLQRGRRDSNPHPPDRHTHALTNGAAGAAA